MPAKIAQPLLFARLDEVANGMRTGHGAEVATLSEDVRSRIVGHASGQERVDELFRLVQGRIIPRVAIETVARQKDPMKRMRDARLHLRREGILVLGHQGEEPAIARRRGFPVPKKGEAISIPA